MGPALARAQQRFRRHAREFAARFKQRMLPANAAGGWHTVTPSRAASDLALPPLRAPWLRCETPHAYLMVTAHRRRWLLATPSTALSSRAPRRVRPWALAVARGLGGLARLKLRYKGKSFR